MSQQIAEIMDEHKVRRALTRIAFEMIEKNHGCRSLLLAGIQTRGVPLAERLADKLGEVEGFRPPVLSLDIRPFRDDMPYMEPPDLPDIPGLSGCTVVIVDYVLYTGRSVRAAIEAISCMGRAARIQLAVLVDRGHRELPIRPDYVGKNLPTAQNEHVHVSLRETDGEDRVTIVKRQQSI